MVTGKTNEEVDTNLKLAIEKSNNIRKDLGVPIKEKKKSGGEPYKGDKPPKANPSNNSGDNGVDTGNIPDPKKNPKEFKKWMEELGIK